VLLTLIPSPHAHVIACYKMPSPKRFIYAVKRSRSFPIVRSLFLQSTLKISLLKYLSPLSGMPKRPW
jgi:hypothetical protein